MPSGWASLVSLYQSSQDSKGASLMSSMFWKPTVSLPAVRSFP